MAVVDGFADDEHGGEGEVVVVDYLGEVFELTTVDALVWPGEMVAGGDRGVFRVLHEQFALNIIDDGGREEDAHGRLAASQQVQLLALGHGGAALTAGEDNGLGALGDGKLAPQLGCCCEE